MKKRNYLKTSGIMFYMISIFFYVTAIIRTVWGENLPILCYCLGSAFLCFGAVMVIKSKRNKAGDDNL